MSTYPDLDADWRIRDASARNSKSILQALAAELEGPTTAAIQIAIHDFAQQLLNCQKLSEQINAHYKRSKKKRLKAVLVLYEKLERGRYRVRASSIK
jgi:hypothetical protein